MSRTEIFISFIILIVLLTSAAFGTWTLLTESNEAEAQAKIKESEYLTFEGHIMANGLYRYNDGKVDCIILKGGNNPSYELSCDWMK